MSHFNQLLKAALAQPEPQRLLFLLAKTDRTNHKKQDIAKGTLTPVMCVDKLPAELTSYTELINEADAITNQWDIMLIAGMNGEQGKAPTTEEAEPLLNKMANDVIQGQDLSRYLILDRDENLIEMVTR
jgi:hypothetical protein